MACRIISYDTDLYTAVSGDTGTTSTRLGGWAFKLGLCLNGIEGEVDHAVQEFRVLSKRMFERQTACQRTRKVLEHSVVDSFAAKCLVQRGNDRVVWVIVAL
jgi:hypothetical protein